MSKFQVGDRVKVYGRQFGAPESLLASRETIKRIYEGGPGAVMVETEDGYHAHVKQCRKLVKKKRMEFWLCFQNANDYPGIFSEEDNAKYCLEECLKRDPSAHLIHVREVVKK